MSADTDQQGPPDGADELQEAAAPNNNFERLLTHLGNRSLAARLVRAYAEPRESTPGKALRAVAATRLEQLKAGYDKPDDQQN